MKHTFSFLLLLCMLLLTLAGCDSDVSPADEEGVSGTGMVFCEEGIYFLDEFTSKNGISFYSYQSGERKTLCPDPLCTHENKSGCFMYGKRFVRGVLEDNILYFSAWDIVKSTCILGSYDLSDMQLTEYISYDRDSMLEEFVKCGDWLYYYLLNADGGYDIRRVSIQTKEDVLLCQYDQYICSIQVDHGYLAFGTWEGIYLSDLSCKDIRLAVRFNESMASLYYYYLKDGYLYYPANRYTPEIWENDGGRHDGQLLPCDFYRCSADSDEQSGERVMQNVYGSLFFHQQKIFYLPAELYTMLRYYFHNQQSGDADLPENLFAITGNRGGIACYDLNAGSTAPFRETSDLNITRICYMDADKMVVLGFDLRAVTIGEDRFIKGGYLSYNHNRGYYIINLKDNTYQMLVQPVPDQNGY